MDWFERLQKNPYIQTLLLADDQGRVLRSTRSMISDGEFVASMLQSAEVLTQTLAAELGCGQARMLHISTSHEHILLFPLAESTFFLLVLLDRTAPLKLILIELERVISQITANDLAQFVSPIEQYPRPDDTPVLDAQELIEAVREWLHTRSTD